MGKCSKYTKFKKKKQDKFSKYITYCMNIMYLNQSSLSLMLFEFIIPSFCKGIQIQSIQKLPTNVGHIWGRYGKLCEVGAEICYQDAIRVLFLGYCTKLGFRSMEAPPYLEEPPIHGCFSFSSFSLISLSPLSLLTFRYKK